MTLMSRKANSHMHVSMDRNLAGEATIWLVQQGSGPDRVAHAALLMYVQPQAIVRDLDLFIR